MQGTTFHGLENIVNCVKEHLKHLHSFSNSVNECAQYLNKEIELHLPKAYADREIVKLTLRGNYSDIERNVRTQIKDLIFLDTYFNIIFVELTSLRLGEIQEIISVHRAAQFF